jgi:hypothetical protein
MISGMDKYTHYYVKIFIYRDDKYGILVGRSLFKGENHDIYQRTYT